MASFEIIFLPFKKSVKVDKGESILDAAIRMDIPIETICGGKGECGKCKVKILSSKGFSEITEKEKRLIGKKDLLKGMRLACLTKVYGNLILEVPEESLRRGFVRDKTYAQRKVNLLPAVSLYPIEIPPPSLSSNESDFERIKKALKEKYSISIARIDPFSFKESPSILRKEKGNVNIAVWMDDEVVGVRKKSTDELYGLAVDIGTTTIGAYLMSLKDGRCLSSGSALNPQIKFGEDIMTRIAYVVNKGQKGLDILHNTLIEGLNSLTENLVQDAHVSKDGILEATIVGNTVMHHIFLNIDPSYLGVSPFVPFLSSSINLKARDLGLNINPSANVYVLPVEAGFVGADNVGVILALKPYLQDEYLLIIDIGTNGEIVLGNRERLISASCATGPAFEGAHIKSGIRADAGAIEEIKIDPRSYEVAYKVIGNKKPKGICGSGIIDAVSELFKASLIDNSGRFKKGIKLERLRKGTEGIEFVIAWTKETAIGRDITITQKDIRTVQLAKAAIYGGSKILLKHLGIEKPSRVMLAGVFGNYIDVNNAYTLGMFPFTKPSEIIPVGNAAGEGAIFALLNRKEREEAEKIAKRIEYIELTLQKEFRKEFLDALYIPHKKDHFYL